MEENRRNSDRNSFKKRSRKKRKKKVLKNVLLSICLIISIAAGYFAARAQVMFNQSLNHVKRNYDSALATVDLSGIHVDSDNDIVNLLFIGNDHRKEWNGFVEEGLPDVMMIGTLDKKHKSLKLTSLLRDMKIYSSSSGKYRKLNECFNDGGIKGIYKAIAENFNIKLDGYVMVGFDAFTQAINTIGGVEVELTQTEVDYLSKTNFIRKKKYRKGLKVGKQKLNGYQALGYCRIRKGYDVIGTTLELFVGSSCCNTNTYIDAKNVCNQIGVPHFIFNYKEEFKKYVIDDFIDCYANCKTPNPCIECNKYMKFGLMWEKAKEMGCNYIATGHYAKTEYSDE